MIRSRLKHVMNPMAGLDVIRTELVTKMEINDGVIRVLVDLPSNHQFATNIKEEILEKLGGSENFKPSPDSRDKSFFDRMKEYFQ